MAMFSEEEVHKFLYAKGLEAVIVDNAVFDAPQADVPSGAEKDAGEPEAAP